MNHEIKVLFLDIDNTLLDFDAGDGAMFSEGRTGIQNGNVFCFYRGK